ncbi:MAG: ATP-binding cassette domain-containing protein, partial [Pseudomonadota bacterium]
MAETLAAQDTAAQAAQPVLSINNIEVIYNHVILVLKGVSLDVPLGGITALLGANGAGKTTTLRLISGLEKLDAGSIHIGGRDVGQETPAQRDVAMVFQQYSLYPHLTVRDNLAFPLRSPILKTPEDQVARRVKEIS